MKKCPNNFKSLICFWLVLLNQDIFLTLSLLPLLFVFVDSDGKIQGFLFYRQSDICLHEVQQYWSVLHPHGGRAPVGLWRPFAQICQKNGPDNRWLFWTFLQEQCFERWGICLLHWPAELHGLCQSGLMAGQQVLFSILLQLSVNQMNENCWSDGVLMPPHCIQRSSLK